MESAVLQLDALHPRAEYLPQQGHDPGLLAAPGGPVEQQMRKLLAVRQRKQLCINIWMES